MTTLETAMFRVDSYLGPEDSFSLARKSLDPAPPRLAHFHDYYEVFLVEQGTALHHVNGIDQRLESGALVFIRPSDLHALSADPATGCRIVNVLFRQETADHLVHRYASDLAGRFFWAPGALPAQFTLAGPRRERAVNTMLELQTAHRSLTRIEEFLLTVMMRVTDLPAHSQSGVPSWLTQACDMARTPEVFRQGASGFVEAAGRGHEHVCRMMKQHLGLTPSAYVNRVRMEHAAYMLSSDDLTIPDIAEACGIENLSHFYRTFRQHYGLTPKAYRQQHRKAPV